MPEPAVFRDLLTGGWSALTFEPFRGGIERAVLYDGGQDGPSAAVLRYAPGAQAPRHRHPGYETIMVLEGEQADEFGSYPAGSTVVNAPGSEHTVVSRQGCVVLIIWDKPVEFLE